MLSNTPWLAGFLSLIGLSKQLQQLCPYLIGLFVVHKCETKFSSVCSWWQDTPLLTITLNFDFTSSRVSQNFLVASCHRKHL